MPARTVTATTGRINTRAATPGVTRLAASMFVAVFGVRLGSVFFPPVFVAATVRAEFPALGVHPAAAEAALTFVGYRHNSLTWGVFFGCPHKYFSRKCYAFGNVRSRNRLP